MNGHAKGDGKSTGAGQGRVCSNENENSGHNRVFILSLVGEEGSR